MSGSSHIRASRILELDGVRGMAAILVVYCHLFLPWVPATPEPVFWLRTLSGLSWTGVHLFFILSGYLIGGILLRERTSPNYFSAFYARRAFRILPLYFFVLTVFFLFRAFGGTLGPEVFASGAIPLWTYPLLIQNFPMAATCDWGSPLLGVTWSVALEEQFYLFLPLVIRLLPVRFQLGVFIALTCAGPLFRMLAPVCHPSFLLPGSFEPLFAGVLLAWASIHFPRLYQSAKFRWGAFTVFLLAADCMAAIAARQLKPGAFDISIFTVFWATFLWLVIAHIDTPFTAPLRWKPLRWIGTISYGIYLFHPLVNHLLFAQVFGATPDAVMGLRGFLLSCGSLALILAISAASFFLVERKLVAIGHRFRYRPS